MKSTITEYQKKLRLSNNLIDIYETISFENKEQFMHDLLESLYLERIENIKARNMKKAKFPAKKTLATYEWGHVQLPDSVSITEITSLDFIENQENLILYGNIGAGKTHLGIALGIKAIQEQKVVFFFTVHDLINTLLSEKEKGTYPRFMKRLKKAHMLVLDEWGYLPLHQEGARLLFEVISLCYEHSSIILTTNIEFSHWKNFLFDEKLTAAIIDRVIHHSHLLLFDGPSHRKQNSLMKS